MKALHIDDAMQTTLRRQKQKVTRGGLTGLEIGIVYKTPGVRLNPAGMQDGPKDGAYGLVSGYPVVRIGGARGG